MPPTKVLKGCTSECGPGAAPPGPQVAQRFPTAGERVTGASSRGMARWPLKGRGLAFPPGRYGDRGLLMVLDGALILTWLNSSILKPKILNSVLKLIS